MITLSQHELKALMQLLDRVPMTIAEQLFTAQLLQRLTEEVTAQPKDEGQQAEQPS